MPKIPLMEGERGAVPFIVDRSKPFVTEARNGISFSRIPGRFSICDSVNGNNRRYPKKVWEKNLAEGSTLRQAIAKNAAFGLLEHPADGRISLQSPICILVTDAKIQPSIDETTKQPVTEVVGEIIIVETAEGQKLKALINVGYNPMVSSRGFGSVVKMTDGVDEVQDDYVCEGWDCVLKPSFERAELFVPRESKQESQPAASATAAAAVKQESQPAPLTEQRGANLWKCMRHVRESGHGQPPTDRAGQPSLGPGGVNEPAPGLSPEELAPLMARFKQMAIDYYNSEGQDGNAVWAEWERSGQLNDPDFIAAMRQDLQYGAGKRDWRDTERANPNSAAGRMPPAAPHDWQGDPNDPRQHPTESKNLPQAASSPAAGAAAAPAASAKQTLTEKSMTINEIKSRIGAIRGTQVPKDPARFAEGLNEMAQIHQEIANFIAEDGKRGWQGQQLHDELSRIEKSWSETVLAPTKTAARLTENYSKVLKVTKCLGEAAINIRKKLSEALANNAEAAQLIEELTERGQAWVAIADKRKGTVAELEHKLEVACEALDIIKQRYHEDMTAMGRHVVTLEFAEKAQTPEIQKLLKEAKKPADIIAIREKLDPEAAAKAKLEAEGGSSEECKVCKKKPCCCKKEAKQESQQPQTAAGVAAAAVAATAPGATTPGLNEARVLVPSVRSISESVEMARRLSGAKSEATEASPKK